MCEPPPAALGQGKRKTKTTKKRSSRERTETKICDRDAKLPEHPITVHSDFSLNTLHPISASVEEASQAIQAQDTTVNNSRNPDSLDF